MGEKYRITMLTQRLIRLEYQEDGIFCDEKTACIQNRDFGNVEYDCYEKDGFIFYETPYLLLKYNKKELTASGLNITLKTKASDWRSVWYYGDKLNTLGGTARTLDFTDGDVDVGDGIISRFGFSLLDDSDSSIIKNDHIYPREHKGIDLYFFGYAREYNQALKDYYHLTGNVPMLPRYALGNWWSRYYEYTQEEYLRLMDKFENKNVPLSVAVIDMDWHLVKSVPEKYGSGWTGYTWNRELFPDPEGFLSDLHKRGLKTTLNVHPANGCQPFEEAYEEMRKAMNVEEGKGVEFNCADHKFMEAYFKYLHHPLEKMGVDFWWIDWQQGTVSNVEGLDPLFVLNHEHYEDIKRNGDRALILSRYYGPGSHRYPVGFSGDTAITWNSLAIQPKFTAQASNIGYTWWSHDIGGHYKGVFEQELFVRWVQFGVFSPINRLHSSNNEFTSKEPWLCDMQNEHIISEFLRLRHRLIPYTYTAMQATSESGDAICKPIYYEYPYNNEAYLNQDEYFFGSELLVAPITSKMIEKIHAGMQNIWLPEGTWLDFFTGKQYEGNGFVELYRGIDSMPVLAKAGAIVPMTNDMRVDRNPESIVLRIFAGADGHFAMYEDDDKANVEKKLISNFNMDFKNGELSMELVGDSDIIPQNRTYTLEFVGFEPFEVDGFVVKRDGVVQSIELDKPQNIRLSQSKLLCEDRAQLLFDRLFVSDIDVYLKQDIHHIYMTQERSSAIKSISALVDDENVFKFLLEVM